MMEKKLLVIFLTAICLMTTSFLFISFLNEKVPNVMGSESIDYIFEDSILYNGEIVNTSSNYNLDKVQNNTGIHNGTYTFTNDTNGVVPTDWTDGSTGACYVETYSEFLNHNKVMTLDDRQAGFHAKATSEVFSNQENGFIEFWIARSGSDAHGNPMLGYSGATFGINMLATGGVFNLYYGGSVHSSGVAFNENQWYHILLDFDCSDNSLNLTINSILRIEGQFQNIVGFINKISIDTDNTKDNYAYMIDAIGYSWDNDYDLFDNYFPIMENTETDQVKSFEFALNSEGYFNELGLDNVNNWYDIEDSASNPDSVNCYTSDDYIDRSIRIYQAQQGNAGITQDFNIDEGIMFNISIELDIVKYGYPDSEIYIDIYSYDVTKIYAFRLNGTAYTYGSFDKPADLSYFDGADWITVMSDIPVKYNLNQKFNLVWLDGFNSFLTYEYNEVSEQFLIPTLNSVKTGLGNISIYAINDNAIVYGNLDISIDSVAVNIDGVSMSTEPINVSFSYIPIESWNTEIYNLIEFTFNTDYFNNISLWINNDTQIIEYETTIGIQSYTRNVYGNDILYSLIIDTFSNDTYEITNVKIHGNALVSNSEYFYPTYDFDNIDLNESYFWVDSENDLRYTMTMDDSGTEYIEAEFIISQSTEGYVMSFTHFNSHYKGFSYTELAYNDKSTTTFVMSTSESQIGKRFDSSKTITTITIHVSDNDYYSSSEMSGYVSNFKFVYSSASLALISTTFIAILPTLFILIPLPIFMYNKYDKKPIVFIGTFFVMALVCTITSLIPIWLMFVFIIGLAGIILEEMD